MMLQIPFVGNRNFQAYRAVSYTHLDKNDVHDVMLLCETFQIAIPDEYKEK